MSGAAAHEDFFARLTERTNFTEVADPRAYTDAPESWLIAITDVRGSTKAIEEGRYKDVNALGVASIIAMCNASPELELPYVFGGDGATLLVPTSRKEAYEAALRGARRVSMEAYGLELRAAMVPIAELVAKGHAVRVARFRASKHVCLAMFAGSGIAAAEKWVKDPVDGARWSVSAEGEERASFDGFECRWQPVENKRGLVVSLLVHAQSHDDAEKAREYREVLDAIDHAIGARDARPISEDRLHLRPIGGDFSQEAKLLSGAHDGAKHEAARRNARFKALVGGALLTLGVSAGGFDGKHYATELVENTDFRKFDETLRMVLDLSVEEAAEVERFLESRRADGHLVYGMHRAPSAMVTCFVRSYAGNHVHFVDGANGGYALAAKQLKSQLLR